jgi:hypothetical protein
MSSCRRWRTAVSAKRAIDSSQVETRTAFELAGGTPHIEENLADKVFRRGGVAHDAKHETVNPHIVTGVKGVHRGSAATGNACQQHFIRGRLGSDDALFGCGVDGDDVLHD